MIAPFHLFSAIARSRIRAQAGLVCTLTLPCVLAFAQNQDVEKEEPDLCNAEQQQGCVPVGKWQISLGLGAGVRDNPLVDRENTPLFLIPHVSYYGERFFFDTYVGGVTLFETQRSMLNAIVTISFDQIYFRTDNIGNFALESGPIAYEANNSDQESPLSNAGDNIVSEDFVNDEDGSAYDRIADQVLLAEELIVVERLHSRDTTFLGGFELAHFIGGWDISWQFLKDINHLHQGLESRLSMSRFFLLGNNKIDFSSGITWQDDKTMNYYWGIYESEVKNPELAYRPDSGFSPFVRIDWRRRLFQNWSLQATFHHKWLSDEISESPLVEEDTVLTVFVGGVYHF